MIENMKNGKEKKLTVLTRKVDLVTFIKEFLSNLTILYVIYGFFNGWNPLKWNMTAQILFLFFLCVYYPYRDAKRDIKNENEKR